MRTKINNYSETPKKIKLNTKNISVDDGDVIITDSEYTYTMLDKIVSD